MMVHQRTEAQLRALEILVQMMRSDAFRGSQFLGMGEAISRKLTGKD
jgi:hypothetical protein